MTTRRASGQLIHEDAIQKPLYGLSIELWDRDTLVDDRLGSATTDREGRFDIIEVNWDQDESDHTHDISNVKLYL